MYKFFLRIMNRYFRICKKSGKIIAIKVSEKKRFLLFPVIGILAIVWFLFRCIPKPSRIAYPCQRIAAGIGITFITFLAGTLGSLSVFKLIKGLAKKRSVITLVCCLLICAGAGLGTSVVIYSFISDQPVVYADWNPGDSPNSPIGIAKGINPGRVTWAHDPDATADTPSGSWYQSGNVNQQAVNDMFSSSINALTGQSGNPSAWDELFRSFNQTHGRGDNGYLSGETIAIKINTVNTSSQNKFGSAIDATGETVLAIVDQLVSQAGIPQSSIYIYDGGVGTIGSYVFNCVNKLYSGLNWRATSGWGSIQACDWVDDAITYSDYSTTNADSYRIVRCLWDADYLINLALLKKHENQTAVTLCGKNHFGSIRNCESIHSTINDYINGMGTYNSLVDLQGHENIGGKTLLFIIDGLWGAPAISGQPVRWALAPFNNDWPSSVFMSQDPVAIDSVALDFINAEWTLWDNADNYLHEAAQADNPPSGTFYDPENDGTSLQSLGVHEHWNNAQSKRYSRNLGSGSGIELVSVTESSTEQTPVPGSPGDVNNNGTIDIVDALLLAQYYVGLDPQNFDINNADTNCDGSIDIIDALLIAQFYVGLISGFC